MRIQWKLKTGVAVLTLGLALPPLAEAQPCSGQANCVALDFPAEGQPEAKPPVIRVSKEDAGGQPGKFMFASDSVTGRTAWVIFKCQDEAAGICRTPAVTDDANQSEVWAFKVAGNSANNRFRVRQDLDLCDVCSSHEKGADAYEQCLSNYCRYPYMVVDLTGGHGSHPPLDPAIIIEPQ